MKVGDLVYWHEDAWLMKAGVPPKVVHAIIVKESDSQPAGLIWHVVRCDTGQKGIVHESDLNVRVCRESR